MIYPILQVNSVLCMERTQKNRELYSPPVCEKVRVNPEYSIMSPNGGEFPTWGTEDI